MAEYEIFTKTIIDKTYKFTLESPVDMGRDSERITDMMMRRALEVGTITLPDDPTSEDASYEEITEVQRNGKTVWTKVRRRKPAKVEKAPTTQLDMELDALNKKTKSLDTVNMDETT